MLVDDCGRQEEDQDQYAKQVPDLPPVTEGRCQAIDLERSVEEVVIVAARPGAPDQGEQSRQGKDRRLGASAQCRT